VKPILDINEINSLMTGSKVLRIFNKEIPDEEKKVHKYTMTWYELDSQELMLHASSDGRDEYILVENAAEGFKIAMNMLAG